MALRESQGLGQSSSEAPGVVGISVLEQVHMLVREGIGECVRCGEVRRPSGQVLMLEAKDVSLIGETDPYAEASRNISNVLRRAEQHSTYCTFAWQMTMACVDGSSVIAHPSNASSIVAIADVSTAIDIMQDTPSCKIRHHARYAIMQDTRLGSGRRAKQDDRKELPEAVKIITLLKTKAEVN
jgi:hypothetical protein